MRSDGRGPASSKGCRAEPWRHLPLGRKRRRGCRLRKRPPLQFAPEPGILSGPDIIARKDFGHRGKRGPPRPMAPASCP